MKTRTKLIDKASVKKVMGELTIDEKLNLVGEYSACHTLAIPDMDIPSLYLLDGATGVNGNQILLDYLSAPERADAVEETKKLFTRFTELAVLNEIDLDEAEKQYKEEPMMLNVIQHMKHFRPRGKEFLCFPSGINIGAAFDKTVARDIGEAIGQEMRASGVDNCMGPNVDIIRDPLGGRGYEMYGEDPRLVADTAVEVIKGIQSAGTAACAKHFLANNQETNRNTADTHVSERALREIYGRGFQDSVQRANVLTIMSAYNSINGKFSSYNGEILNDWLRKEWGFDGTVVCDWGAVKERKAEAIMAGMDMILCGPTDMTEVKKQLENGTFSIKDLDRSVERILNLILRIRDSRAGKEFTYKREVICEKMRRCIAAGSILLKNEGGGLPLKQSGRVTFYGKRSKKFMECGTGSTAVITGIHSNVFEACEKYRDVVISYEDMDNADVLVYTVTAPAGENADRADMDIEKEDRQRLPRVLKLAKEKGLKTVVLLNVAGPVDMRTWEKYADSILCIFIPGCMGGVAAADMLFGEAYPGGKLPVTFPKRLEDTPCYPNFPGEGNHVYYGEGIFVGYRSYEKRKVEVQYPFGYGLSYTKFEISCREKERIFRVLEEDTLDISVIVKNTGHCKGSEVVQIYASEENPHVLRPVKELVGFAKAELEPQEEQEISVQITKDAFRYFDADKKSWILPVGKFKLYVATSSAKEDIIAEIPLRIIGESAYKLNGNSRVSEVIKNKDAVQIVNKYTDGLLEKMEEGDLAMMLNDKLADFLGMVMISMVPDAVELNEILTSLSDELEAL